jgi:hypothetical protein
MIVQADDNGFHIVRYVCQCRGINGGEQLHVVAEDAVILYQRLVCNVDTNVSSLF